MLYSQAERDVIISKVKKRSALVWIPTAALLALSIASFVWFRLQHNTDDWFVTALLTILAGGYYIFFYGVYLGPLRKYKKHLDYMLDGRKRETVGTLTEISDTIMDKDGIDCYSVTLNIGDHNDPEDDRLFYLDAYKTLDGFKINDPVCIESNDRMIASVTKQ